jgi:hypothetical protein
LKRSSNIKTGDSIKKKENDVVKTKQHKNVSKTVTDILRKIVFVAQEQEFFLKEIKNIQRAKQILCLCIAYLFVVLGLELRDLYFPDTLSLEPYPRFFWLFNYFSDRVLCAYDWPRTINLLPLPPM